MPYFPDLSPYGFLTSPHEVSPNVLNVGWLSRPHPFNRGTVGERMLETLLRLCSSPVRLTRGFHHCEFCKVFPVSMPVDGMNISLGNGEIRLLAGNGKTYAAPTLICHYIAAHGYCPPQEFLNALASL